MFGKAHIKALYRQGIRFPKKGLSFNYRKVKILITSIISASLTSTSVLLNFLPSHQIRSTDQINNIAQSGLGAFDDDDDLPSSGVLKFVVFWHNKLFCHAAFLRIGSCFTIFVDFVRLNQLNSTS